MKESHRNYEHWHCPVDGCDSKCTRRSYIFTHLKIVHDKSTKKAKELAVTARGGDFAFINHRRYEEVSEDDTLLDMLRYGTPTDEEVFNEKISDFDMNLFGENVVDALFDDVDTAACDGVANSYVNTVQWNEANSDYSDVNGNAVECDVPNSETLVNVLCDDIADGYVDIFGCHEVRGEVIDCNDVNEETVRSDNSNEMHNNIFSEIDVMQYGVICDADDDYVNPLGAVSDITVDGNDVGGDNVIVVRCSSTSHDTVDDLINDDVNIDNYSDVSDEIVNRNDVSNFNADDIIYILSYDSSMSDESSVC